MWVKHYIYICNSSHQREYSLERTPFNSKRPENMSCQPQEQHTKHKKRATKCMSSTTESMIITKTRFRTLHTNPGTTQTHNGDDSFRTNATKKQTPNAGWETITIADQITLAVLANSNCGVVSSLLVTKTSIRLARPDTKPAAHYTKESADSDRRTHYGTGKRKHGIVSSV